MANKRAKRRRHDFLVLKLILLVAIVLVVFEGRLVMTMISVSSLKRTPNVAEGASEKESTASLKSSSSPGSAAAGSADLDSPLAGLPSFSPDGSRPETDPQTGTSSSPDSKSSAIVPEADTPVDDSYFSDAVFIGDSRMEGFRNASGITQGQFFTSVGMSLSGLISKPLIKQGDETITVAAAVSGGSYGKIYLMLGTNDLGEYDLEGFHDRFTSAAARLLELQPNAILYVCSIIYVEEAKAMPVSGEYVNNTNVDKLNAILLQICEEQGYYYIDLNEILSNGNGGLIEGASSDGVHVYPDYCKQMLDYLKSHYVTEQAKEPETSGEASEESSESSPKEQEEDQDA